MIRRFAAVLTCATLCVGIAAAQTPAPAPLPTPLPTPAPTPFGIPLDSLLSPSPAATRTPSAPLIAFTAQLLDVRGGYVYFTTGDAFKLSDAYRLVDYDSGAVTTQRPEVKMYARATFDPNTKQIIELAITKKKLAASQNYSAVKPFAIVASSPAPAPEIAGQRLTGRPVSVVFEVTAPPTTQLTDTVYISTDAGGWNPQEIKLDRIDAYRYRASRTYASGTRFAFRVTRGTWNSVERGQDNLEPDPHQFAVREVDALAARVTVYHWSDENPSQPQAGPNAIPTPFNANPFGGRGGIVVPQIPTPRPTPQR
jgi:hypothetical protein